LAHLTQSGGTGRGQLGVLGEVGWLSQQPPDFQAVVARLGRWREFRPKEIIYLAGSAPDGLYGLAAGTLEISFPLVGEEQVTVHRAEPGFWIGEAAILASQDRFITLTAATPVKVLFVSRIELRRLIEADPRHWGAFYEQSVGNQIITLTLLAEVLSLTPRARVARLLLRLADAEGVVTGNQEDLARLLGMTRSSIRRVITNLAESKLIATGYSSLRILDHGGLEGLVREA